MLMHAKESKQMTRVRWHVFTTRGSRAEHVQLAAISDRSVNGAENMIACSY